MALFGHDRLGVELHAFDGQGLVAHAHDFFNGAVVVAGPGSHFQAIGQGVFVDHQAVVTGSLQGIVQAAEHAYIIVVHRRHLAMHHLAGPDDIAAVHLADGLVAQANAQDRQLAGEVANGVHGDARLIRGARARGNHQPLGLQGFNLLNGDFVVAVYLHVGTQLGQVLHHVVGEGIVVIDHQQHNLFLRLNGRSRCKSWPRHGRWPGPCSWFLSIRGGEWSLPPRRRRPGCAGYCP